MLLEIWSDVVCPFCYIGRRRLKEALSQFAYREQVEVVWKSFQLNPELKSHPGKKIEEYLSETKGWSLSQAREVNRQVSNLGETAGIHFQFEKIILANSFDAQRLIQFAAAQGKSEYVVARIFRAYFSEGRDIAKHFILSALGADAGLDSSEVLEILRSDMYSREVGRDILEARELGIRGVPYFLFNSKHSVSGAQDTGVFLDALNIAWKQIPENREFDMQDPQDGSVCTPDGECEE